MLYLNQILINFHNNIMSIDRDSLERLVPDEVDTQEITGAETLKLHMERYEFAAQFLNSTEVYTIADCACGVGYGTAHLATNCSALNQLTGIDISKEAIEYAKQRYANPKTRFQRKNIFEFRVERELDAIISLETIEHVPEPERLIAHFSSLIRTGGYLIASVPITPSVDANPHHLNDFTESSFRKMFMKNGFVEISCFRQVQPYSLFSIIAKTEKRTRDVRKNLPFYYLKNPYALVKRIRTIFVDGFNNKYITIIWKKDK